MDKYDCIKLFVRVAQLGSFTATANQLNLTQSAVSKKIAWLENRIGFTLFHRSSRKIQLTTQGAEYFVYCEKQIIEMEHTELRLKGELHQVSGELTLSVPSAMATMLLAEPISQFMSLHPNLTINVSVNDQQINLIKDNIDIAIRASVLEDSSYKARLLFQNKAIYFSSPTYLKNKTPPRTIDELKEHDCLTYSLMKPSNIWHFSLPEKETIKTTINEIFKSDSSEMLLQMALLGHGIAALPSWMIEKYLVKGELIHLLSEYHAITLPMYALYKTDEFQPYRVRAFIDYLVDYFQNQ
ncbi:LysR family transcriptional regulator [Aliivibrio sifiae]|uniref:LysR family transcriptional regulator n=1 Tax=Aliivibrio sifiae TaxID=566293 RepID=A0A2S7XIY9_9GAMM|nr:LysR family transcriptional regulator [Aliivibrio sifiae]PQJ93694.1 LysR family transcriptional regulator [Aliivibrio sifiae]GLR74199.1 LysR family transcriptional regulator [Aliivibrio sifiae]